MRSIEKKPTSTKRTGSTIRGSGSRIGDADSTRLQNVASKMGNGDLNKHLEGNANQRDQLLQFIAHRLKEIHNVQNVEQIEIGNERQWFKEVAKGADGYHLPDPRRWHECTELFDRAAEALCEGHLGRGAQLLEQALEKESATYDTIPKMVLNKLHTRERDANNAPVSLGYIASGASCSATSGPADLRYADLILNVRDHVSTPPALNVPNWWDAPKSDKEEEEEEDNQEG
jgi:hypothetical protein